LVLLSHVAPDAVVVRERVMAEAAPEDARSGGLTVTRPPPTITSNRPTKVRRRISRMRQRRELLAIIAYQILSVADENPRGT